jgi:hypothetical protein
LVHVGRCRLAVGQFGPGALAQQADAGQARAEVIVDVAGDAGAFALQGALAFQLVPILLFLTSTLLAPTKYIP